MYSLVHSRLKASPEDIYPSHVYNQYILLHSLGLNYSKSHHALQDNRQRSGKTYSTSIGYTIVIRATMLATPSKLAHTR